MRNRLIACIVALLIPSAWAQPQGNADWDNLKQIQRGQRIKVVEMNLKATTGKFVSFSDTKIVLEVDKTTVTIPREAVYRVNEDHQRGRNAFIASLGGAGFGAVIGAAASRDVHTSGDKAAVVVITAGAWAGILAGISALVTRNPTVYRAENVPAATTPTANVK